MFTEWHGNDDDFKPEFASEDMHNFSTYVEAEVICENNTECHKDFFWTRDWEFCKNTLGTAEENEKEKRILGKLLL